MAAANITDELSSDQWREVISAVYFNSKPAELVQWDKLSARLMSAGLIYASHAWYVA